MFSKKTLLDYTWSIMRYIKYFIRDFESIKKYIEFSNLNKKQELFPNLKYKVYDEPKVETP